MLLVQWIPVSAAPRPLSRCNLIISPREPSICVCQPITHMQNGRNEAVSSENYTARECRNEAQEALAGTLVEFGIGFCSVALVCHILLRLVYRP
jgi:hypothetical protein